MSSSSSTARRPSPHKHFSSIHALQTYARENNLPATAKAAQLDSDRDWLGGHTVADAITVLTTGDEQLGNEAAKLADKLALEIPRVRQTWELAPQGAFVSVGSYLAGSPNCMWRLTPQDSDRTPIRIWVGVGSSAVVKAKQLAQRGAALTAFAIALSETRTVTITPYVNGAPDNRNPQFFSWDISTSPLVHSQVAASLARTDVSRGLGLAMVCHLANNNSGYIQWAPEAFTESKCRAVLGAGEQDVWLPPIFAADELINDPINWIRTAIAKVTAGDDVSATAGQAYVEASYGR